MYDFKLPQQEVWNLTPAQFGALSRRKEESDKYHDFRFGMIVSTMINMFVGKKGKTVDAFEVMGHGKAGKGEERIQSPQETALRFRLMQSKLKHKKKGVA